MMIEKPMMKAAKKPKNKCLRVFFVFWFSSFSVLGFTALAREETKNEEKISLDLKDIDVIELLRMLSLKTGKAIVPSREITGRVSIFLNNIAFDDVLDIILLTQGYAYEKKGEIFYIMSNAEYKRLYGKDYTEPRKLKTIKLTYAKPANIFNALSQLKSDIGKIIADEASGTIILVDIPEKLELLEKTAVQLDAPLDTVVYDLNYAKAQDAKAQITTALTPGTGEVIVDERSGKAIVSDLPKKMEKIGRLIKEIDEETRQVFIEADIVEVNLSDKFQRGIDWEKVLSERSLDGLDFVGYFPLTLSNFQKISVGTLANNNYKAVINFLETYGDIRTISQPRISVVNNEEAKILVGSREAYVTQTQSQATSSTVTSEAVEFIDVGVKFKVTPTINKEGFITMKIKPEVSSVSETITTSLGSRIPIVKTSEAETVVKVKDGAMIMIAGLIKEDKRDTVIGLPLLSRIPWVGGLFSSRDKEKKNSELIVFITPHLTRGDTSADLKGLGNLISYQEIANKKSSPYQEEATAVGGAGGRGKKSLSADSQAKIKKPEVTDDTAAKEAGDFAKEIVKRKNTERQKKQETQKKENLETEKPEEEKKIVQLSEALVGVIASSEGTKQSQAGSEPASSLRSSQPYSAPRDDFQRIPPSTDRLQEKKEVEKPIKERKEPKLGAVNLETTYEGDSYRELKDRKNIYRGKSGLFFDQADDHYKEGLRYQESGSFEEAVISYRKVILLDEAYAPVYNQMGIIFQRKGFLEDAREMYLRAAELNPEYPKPYTNLALISQADSDLAKAYEYWAKRVSLKSPGDVRWFKKARACLKQIKPLLDDAKN
ncbi:MAG: Pilus (MSHA type) biogenesis protein MshL [Parcubacteria group bacterium GW2011_GWA2_43_17]|nr:MAG: Pilus (MSHA type) biogenesis protein MshL [Parcubacteria group bacterium GW2011_GWA2_43_17]KKT90726.1 MAG: Pilus (MSHA type) biogenesis protein MshL [Parcubacteria group bacterium GW2011_GWF2_45_11]